MPKRIYTKEQKHRWNSTYYYKNVEASRNRDKKYYYQDVEKAREKNRVEKLIERRLHPERVRERERRRRIKHPERVSAIAIANTLKRSGVIKVPLKCSCCGIKKKLQMHHPDYSKPKEVVFLCGICHAFIHRQLRNAMEGK